jgi:olefin beta-lactone synthetase
VTAGHPPSALQPAGSPEVRTAHVTSASRELAQRPPRGLPGLDPAWSRLVTATDHREVPTSWHVLDTHAAATAPAGGDDAGSHGTVGTVLCVHGNPTWSYAFRGLLAAPPDGWRVVAVDQLDMGYSERTGVDRRLADRIEDLSGLTAALRLRDPVVLVAHDWGGPVALGWALAHRSQVAGLVLTNTAVHQPPDAAAPSLIRAARLPGMLDTVTVRTPTFVRGATALSWPPVPAAIRDAYAAPYDTAARRAAVGGFVRDIPLDPDHPSAATLDGIAASLGAFADVPVLLFWGPADPVFSDRYLHDLEARLPHADVHRVEGASHLTPEDTDLAGAVRQWVAARVPAGAGVEPAADEQTAAADPADGQKTAGTPAPAVPRATEPGEASAGGDRRPVWAALREPQRAATIAIAEPASDGTHGAEPVIATFETYAHEVHALAVGLHRHGVQPGDRVACLVTPGLDLATLLYACWRLGAVVVVADAGLGPKGLSRALRSAAAEHLVGIPRALAAATALRWPGRRIAAGDAPDALRRVAGADLSLDQLVTEGAEAMLRAAVDRRARAHDETARAGPAPLTLADIVAAADALLPPAPAPDAEAAIAFTSGSTGPAKGVVYRHRQLEAQRDALTRTYAITDRDRLVAAFAPFALYGPALGIPSMVPDMDVTAPSTLTAVALAEAVATLDATLVFASPAALTNVAATADDLEPHHLAAMAGVRTLMSAGAPVPAELLRRLVTILPNAEAHTPYGMTEVLPVADIELVDIEATLAEVGPGRGVCVGRPVPGVEVAISALDGAAEASAALTSDADVVGEVCIRAGHVKDRYDRLALTELASSRTAGWHRSGDVGHLDAAGRLWIEGRLAHVITTAHGVVTPVGVERSVEQIDHVAMAAAVGVGPPGGQVLVVVVATDPPPGRSQLAPLTLVDRVREAVDAAVGVDVAAVIAVPELPVDVRHESKIDRAEVARRAAKLLSGRGLPWRRAEAGADGDDGDDAGAADGSAA